MATQAPTSIWELLTHPNPTVTHKEPKNKTNTRNPGYTWPRLIKKWDDLESAQFLARAFGGRLFQEAIKVGRDLEPYPVVHRRNDCFVSNEDSVRDLIHKWNKSVVTAGLEPIEREFKPVIWHKGQTPGFASVEVEDPLSDAADLSSRKQPQRKAKKRKSSRQHDLSRLKSDSGSVAWSPLPEISDQMDHSHCNSVEDSEDPTACEERFPKEYKPATKWKSQWLPLVIDESGRWKQGKTNDNIAWPIRQAYSYCIQNMCRYGCILTCEEAFLFRIGPIDNKPEGDPEDAKLLRKCLKNNGWLEYISVPWANHHHHHHGSQSSQQQSWTFNLALWFFHVLAGKRHAVDWTYGKMEEWCEFRAGNTESARQHFSGREMTASPDPPGSAKRKREADDNGMDEDEGETELNSQDVNSQNTATTWEGIQDDEEEEEGNEPDRYISSQISVA